MLTCPEINANTCGDCVSGEVACPLLCGQPGQCQDACTNFDGCNFYSYDPVTEECFMFDDCPALDDNSCLDCVSGSPGCDIDVDEGYLMVIGGYSYSKGS